MSRPRTASPKGRLAARLNVQLQNATKVGVMLHLKGDTYAVRRALDLRKYLFMKYFYAHDLPRVLDSEGKLVPKYDDMIEGWYVLLGDVPNATAVRDAFKGLVDSEFFGNLEVTFVEETITKKLALDMLDAIRHRKGLMDHVDMPALGFV